MNKLWTFGDSFSTGESKPFTRRIEPKNFVSFDDELCEISYQLGEYKKMAYSTHLSKILDLEDYNLSLGGRSQIGIVRDIINQLHLIKKEDIIIVAYSSPFRGFDPGIWKKTVVDRDSKWDGKPLWESAKLYPLEDESILLDYDSYVMLQYKMYMKLPEKYHKLIEQQEDSSTLEAKEIREKILLPLFNKIQDEESKWDFRKKTEWWTSDIDGREEINAKVKLPHTKPGDAGYFPLHDIPVLDSIIKAKRDFKKEMYPGNESVLHQSN